MGQSFCLPELTNVLTVAQFLDAKFLWAGALFRLLPREIAAVIILSILQQWMTHHLYVPMAKSIRLFLIESWAWDL